MRYLAQMLSVLYGALISFFLLYLLGRTNLLSSLVSNVYLPVILNGLIIVLVSVASFAVWQLFGSRIQSSWAFGLLVFLWLALGSFFFYYSAII